MHLLRQQVFIFDPTIEPADLFPLIQQYTNYDSLICSPLSRNQDTLKGVLLPKFFFQKSLRFPLYIDLVLLMQTVSESVNVFFLITFSDGIGISTTDFFKIFELFDYHMVKCTLLLCEKVKYRTEKSYCYQPKIPKKATGAIEPLRKCSQQT